MTDRDGQHDRGAPPDDRVVRLVVGMSRGGTTWMTKTLGHHPGVVGWGESLYWGRGWIEPGPGGWTRDQALGMIACVRRVFSKLPEIERTQGRADREDMKLGAWDDASIGRAVGAFDAIAEGIEPGAGVDPATLFAQINRAVADASDAGPDRVRVAIESTPHHVNHLGRIRDACARAGLPVRVLILTRPGAAFMLSYKHQGDRKAPRIRRMRRRLYHPLTCAKVWARSAGAVRGARAIDPGGAWSMVRTLDEIRESPAEALDEIQRFFGLDPVPIDAARSPSNSSFGDRARPELSPADRFWLGAIAGDELRRAGEPLPRVGWGSARSWASVAWSFVRLPWTASWTVWIMTRTSGVGVLGYLVGFIRRSGR